MTIIKSFSVGYGDMFAIRHASDSFTMIDCFLNDGNKDKILNEIKILAKDKTIKRFISTHPDYDHIGGLNILDDEMKILNFYCVENQAIKENTNNDENFERSFERYCKLRDSDKAFYIYKDCKRKWMNLSDDKRGSAGISVLWPKLDNPHFQQALKDANDKKSPNNISPIIQYSNGDFNFLWFGDLETNFMEKIRDEVLDELPNDSKNSNIIFAPHHGRDSGKIPQSWLAKLKPYLIIIGEAPSENLNYYQGFNTITQNSAGDTIFTIGEEFNIYVSKKNYSTKINNNTYCAEYQSDLGYKLL